MRRNEKCPLPYFLLYPIYVLGLIIQETSFVDATTATIDPGQERPDDFTGPPVTAAEVALLQNLATVYGELALEAAARAKAAARPVTAVRSEAAAKLFAEETKRGELLFRTVRLALGLKASLVMDLQTWRKRGAEAARAAEERRNTTAQDRRKAQQENATAIVLEIVAKTEGAIAAIDAKQPIRRWFAERDHEHQLPDRPVGEIVAMLCRDLGKILSSQDWQGRPWAAAAEALFRHAAQGAERATAATVDPMPASAAAPEPPAEPDGESSAPAQPFMPPEAAVSPDETAPPAVPLERGPGRGADPPEQYARFDRSCPEVRVVLAERGYRTD
jgi:hypothetical protein